MTNNTESPATASPVRRTLRRVLTLAVALAAASTFGLATGAAAAPGSPSNTVCSGNLAAGSYKNLKVEGTCNIDGSAMVSGNVSLDAGDALFLSGAELGGNVHMSAGSAVMAFYTNFHGNINAAHAQALYLFNSTLDKNLTFVGGGAGPNCVDPDPEASFGNDTIVKDSSIAGNVKFDGWAGCWFGFLRNTVGGNVQITNMYANPENINYPGTPQEFPQGLDSTEVIGNVVGGNLMCSGNTPVAQVGDAAPLPNTARKLMGECANL
ncbi:MAG: hypothetical protein KDB08_03820 [Microthrixaceae bacterium]|nr:hypothetical protein [Microthrixaceae bacterium]